MVIVPSLKRCDSKRFVAGNGEFPVCHQFVAMNVNPNLYHPKLAGWKIAGKQSSIVNGYGSLSPLVSHMNMRRMVLFGITVEDRD